jgi:type I restriction enzyme S subunit
MKKGWEIKRLSEIGKVYNGNSINEKVKKDNYSDLDFGFPYIATKDISYKSEINYDNGIKIPFSEKSSFKIAPINTVLICAEGGSAGRKIGFTNQEVCFGNKLFALATNNDIESRYVYYYYFSETFQKHFSVELAGIIGGVSMNKFKDLEIPLPSLLEQQRIVAILDEVFATVAKAKFNAEQNLKNAKELFESYLQGVFENPNNNWEKKKLVDICSFVRGPFGGSLKKNIFKPDGYAVYEQQHAIYDQFDDLRYFIDEKKFNEMKRFELNSGDLIMSCSGTMGKIAIVPDNIKKGIINQALLKLSPSKKVSNIFLKLWMQSESFQNSLKEYAGGAAIQNVASVAILKNIEIPLPDISIQNNIVEKVLLFSSETKKLEANYKQKIKDLEELKKSVLQKAFSGELKT